MNVQAAFPITNTGEKTKTLSQNKDDMPVTCHVTTCHDMSSDRPWSQEEVNRLKSLYIDHDIQFNDILESLPNRNKNAIRLKANRLGLKRPFLLPPEEYNAIKNDKKSISTKDDIDMKLDSCCESNSVYNIIKGIKLYSYIVNLTPSTTFNYLQELHSRSEFNTKNWKILGKILYEDNLRSIVFDFLDKGASSQTIIKKTMNIPESTVVRKFNELENLGIIYPSLKIPRSKFAKGGPRIRIYQTPDATSEQINNACQIQRNLDSPNYLSAFKTTQTIIEDYPNIIQQKETNYKFILNIVKKTGIHFAISDIADIVTTELQNKGIKVWR